MNDFSQKLNDFIPELTNIQTALAPILDLDQFDLKSPKTNNQIKSAIKVVYGLHQKSIKTLNLTQFKTAPQIRKAIDNPINYDILMTFMDEVQIFEQLIEKTIPAFVKSSMVKLKFSYEELQKVTGVDDVKSIPQDQLMQKLDKAGLLKVAYQKPQLNVFKKMQIYRNHRKLAKQLRQLNKFYDKQQNLLQQYRRQALHLN